MMRIPRAVPARIPVVTALLGTALLGLSGCSSSHPSGCSAKTRAVVVQRDKWVVSPQDTFTYCNTGSDDAESYAVVRVPRSAISSFISGNILSVENDLLDGVQPDIAQSQGWSIAKIGYENTPGVLSAADPAQQQRAIQMTIDERGKGPVYVYIFSNGANG
jgi:hypothetical protein